MSPEEAKDLLSMEEPHPFLSLPSPGQVLAVARYGDGIKRVQEILQRRRDRIQQSLDDPYRYGFSLPSWDRADQQLADRAKTNELLILGGNRSSKSTYAAKKVIDALLSGRGKEAWCFQENEKNSIIMQQYLVFKWLPPEFRDIKNSKIASVNFKRNTGFTNSRFVLPNESLCDFRYYKQDKKTIEGGEIDIGWGDELIPLDWLETLRFRIATRRGYLLITFTPIEGWSPTVASILNGAKTLQETEADLLAYEVDPRRRKVPLVQQSKIRASTRVVYFHTKENLFNPWPSMLQALEGLPREEVLVRAYGVPTKAYAGKFPKYNKDVHVINDDQWKAFKRGTWTLIVDPCSGRNFAMVWILTTPDGKSIVSRQWPQPGDNIPEIGDPGDWAIPDGKLADGARGPAQRPWGLGLKQYSAEIARVEAELGREWGGRTVPLGQDAPPIEVANRVMDSRFGNTPTISSGSTTTLIEEFADLEEGALDFIPSSGVMIQEGIVLINDALNYDASKPLTSLNQPKLFIRDCCTDVQFALENWTGADGTKGACKDWVDLLRYHLLGDFEYMDPQEMNGFEGQLGGWTIKERNTD